LPRILSRRTSLRTAERRFGALVCLQSAGPPDENRGYAPAYRPHRRRERRPIRHGRSARILPRRSCSGAAAPAAIHDWTPSSPARMWASPPKAKLHTEMGPLPWKATATAGC